MTLGIFMSIEHKIINHNGQETKVDVIRIKDDSSMVRPVISRRLNFVHKLMGVAPDSVMKVDDSGYQEIAQQTGGNIGFALYLLNQAIPSPETLSKSPLPYVITGEQIRNLGKTFEDYAAWEDCGKPTAIHIRRSGE